MTMNPVLRVSRRHSKTRSQLDPLSPPVALPQPFLLLLLIPNSYRRPMAGKRKTLKQIVLGEKFHLWPVDVPNCEPFTSFLLVPLPPPPPPRHYPGADDPTPPFTLVSNVDTPPSLIPTKKYCDLSGLEVTPLSPPLSPPPPPPRHYLSLTFLLFFFFFFSRARTWSRNLDCGITTRRSTGR